MDLESFRTAHCLTYRGLALQLKLDLPVTRMRQIALGMTWPRPPIIDQIVRGSGRIVSIEAMHKRYSARYSAAA